MTAASLIAYLHSIPPETIIYTNQNHDDFTQNVPVTSRTITFYPNSLWCPSDGRYAETMAELQEIVDDGSDETPASTSDFVHCPILFIHSSECSF